jgi:ferritin-like metal-binding protein YciE
MAVEVLYFALQPLIMPTMATAAMTPDLREAVQHHLEQTRTHVERLDRIFGDLGITPPEEHCEAMEGLLKEGDEIAGESGGDPAARDAALIAAAQRVEHYEMAGYGTARTLADTLGLDDAKDLLQETLDEESDANEKLTKIATGGLFREGVNEDAMASRAGSSG